MWKEVVVVIILICLRNIWKYSTRECFIKDTSFVSDCCVAYTTDRVELPEWVVRYPMRPCLW